LARRERLVTYRGCLKTILGDPAEANALRDEIAQATAEPIDDGGFKELKIRRHRSKKAEQIRKSSQKQRERKRKTRDGGEIMTTIEAEGTKTKGAVEKISNFTHDLMRSSAEADFTGPILLNTEKTTPQTYDATK